MLLIVGCKVFEDVFPPRATFTRNGAKIIQMDIDTWEIAKNFPVDVAVVADIASGLSDLIAETKERLNEADYKAIHERAQKVQESNQVTRTSLEEQFKREGNNKPMSRPRLIKELAEALPSNCAIINRGGGRLGPPFLRLSEPDSYFGITGCMGWGMGAGLGVQLALPHKKVVVLEGDGNAIMSLPALWTARKYNIPIVTVVVNNRAYMACKSLLLSYDQGECAQRGGAPDEVLAEMDIENVDFVKLAEGFDVQAWRVERPEEVAPTLEKAISLGKPALIDAVIDSEVPGIGRWVP